MESKKGALGTIFGTLTVWKLLRGLAAVLVLTALWGQTFFAAGMPADKRPLVLVVYADWCFSCQHLKPVLAHINDKYRNKIRFVRYDITSEETAVRSKERVAQLGLAEFFEKNHEQTSLVVILDGAGREVFRTVNDYDPARYEAVLDQLLLSGAAK